MNSETAPAASGTSLLKAVAWGATSYGLVAWATMSLIFDAGLARPFWPAAGVALGLTLCLGPRVLPGVALGSIAAHLLVLPALGVPLTWEAGLPLGTVGLGAAAQAWLGAGLVRRFTRVMSDGLTAEDVPRLLALGGPVATLLNATVATLAMTSTLLFGPTEPLQHWLTWWLGDIAGVFIAAPLCIALYERARPPWRGHVGSVATVLVAAAVLLLMVMRAHQDARVERVRADLARFAGAAQARMAVALDRAQRAVEGISRQVGLDETVDEAAFCALARVALRDNPAIEALSWNPVVNAAGRAEMEAALGQPLRERDPRHGLRIASARDQYIPVQFIEPVSPNASAIGYDVASDPVRREAIDRALALRDLAASAPILLVQDEGDQFGVLLFAPVSGVDVRTRGFVVGVFRLGTLLESVMGASTALFGARLLDVNQGVEAEAAAHAVADASWNGGSARWSHSFAFGGRQWRLDVAAKHAQIRRGIAVEPGTMALGVLLAGLLSALVLLLLVKGAEDREQRAALAGLNATLQLEIAERERAEAEARRVAEAAEHHARHDAMTGLLNRREFEHQLAALVASVEQGGEHALAFIDLDQFKVVNDTVGHAAGDQVLKQAAGVLLNHTRVGDTLARMGGDEFGLLLRDCGIDRAYATAERLVMALVGHRFLWAGHPFTIGASVGLAGITPGTDASRLLSQADAALYAAKDAGRGRIRVFEADEIEVSPRDEDVVSAAEVRLALDEGRLCLVRQPIVALADGDDLDRFEVFVRMVRPDGSLALPANFLPAAARFGLMADLDRWVIDRALQSAASWSREQAVTINLSGDSLCDPGLPAFVSERLTRLGLDPARVGFEVTETAALRNLPAAQEFSRGVRSAGCAFALDDFGTGMSSFGYLKGLPVDYLKIDSFFVRDVADPTHAIMVQAIHDVAHELGIRTVAEGAETADVVQRLRMMGVDLAQGWALGRPEDLPRPLEVQA